MTVWLYLPEVGSTLRGGLLARVAVAVLANSSDPTAAAIGDRLMKALAAATFSPMTEEREK